MAEDHVERKLAAIFAGDVAGYSRLMGVDEEGTLHQLKAHRKELVDPKITEHRGHIVKSTGDGILVEFVSVVDAVRCAVDIQRGMVERNVEVPADKRIEFRVGINVGDIISDDNDIYGDGVNVAARLEALAEPGGILVSRANSLFWRLTKVESEAAIAMLKQAVERYPDYAPAHSMLAFALLVSRQVGWISMEPQVQQAATLAARAAELDDSDPWAHLALGYVALATRRTDEAVEEFQRALDLNPNFAAAHGYLGFALALDRRSDQAIEHIEQAMRMSPHDPQNAIFNVALAAAHYLAGRYADAVACGHKSLQQRFGLTNGHRIYIASLAQAGQIGEARAALVRLNELQPKNSIAWIERNIPYTPGPMAKFLEGMRKAGLQ